FVVADPDGRGVVRITAVRGDPAIVAGCIRGEGGGTVRPVAAHRERGAEEVRLVRAVAVAGPVGAEDDVAARVGRRAAQGRAVGDRRADADRLVGRRADRRVVLYDVEAFGREVGVAGRQVLGCLVGRVLGAPAVMPGGVRGEG